MMLNWTVSLLTDDGANRWELKLGRQQRLRKYRWDGFGGFVKVVGAALHLFDPFFDKSYLAALVLQLRL